MNFELPHECYEKFTQRTKYGYKTWYRFLYTDECFQRKEALEMAYRDYMRQKVNADVYYPDTETFYKQHLLELNYGGAR